MTSRDKYKVIRKLDSGGMAEVFLGEAEGIQGFKKSVAIKRVLPHYSENKNFIAMFLNEARLGLRLNHANIVQVFDIGRSGDTYFIVMEYVDGTDLKKVMANLRTQRDKMPIELAVFVVMEVCRGLAYAHSYKDQEGKSYQIVHRDVSPPNVLLSRQGEVKLVDFGLAKAAVQIEHTDPGVVKGKFAYLSPEVVFGKPVDQRADLFACGIILFEMLTGERLFLGKTDVDTIKLVRRCDIPSVVESNPNVPSKLEAIVNKALAKDVEDRYQRCDEMAEALAGFLFEHGLKVTSFDLQRFLDKVLSEEEKKGEKAKPSIIDRLIQEELARFASIDDEESVNLDFPADREDAAGSMPLDPFGFRDQDDESQDGESGRAQLPRGDPVDMEGSQTTGKRQSEKDIEVERARSLAQILEGEAQMISEMSDDTVEEKGVNALFVIVVVMSSALAVGLGVISYLLGWIP